METVNLEEFRKEAKRLQRKEAFRKKVKAVGDWYENNKELAMILIPTVIGGGAAVIKGSIKRSNLKKQESVKNLYCYDRSLGHYWRLRRELTNSEWVEIDKRKKNGERLADILSELRVLK